MTSFEHHTKFDAPAGLLILRGNGSIVEAPRFFRRALFFGQRGTPPSIFHLFDPDDPPYLDLHRIFRHPYGATEFHLRVRGMFDSRHGFRYWPVELPPNRIGDAVAFMIVDDSALLQNQAWDLRRLRNRILNDVQDSMSSYFKNRLATLQLLAETLRDAPEIAAESAPRLVTAVRELKSALNRVVTGIDDIESPTEYQDSPVRITDLSSVINTWGTEDVDVHCTIDDVAPTTMIPASSIEQIVLPVVENAIDASPSSSTVEVTIAELEEGFIHFQIVDCGEGMNERVRQRAEDPFFTTRTGQLGLGLSHARQALRDAGGEWKIDSNPRQGTTVTLLLPSTSASNFFA